MGKLFKKVSLLLVVFMLSAVALSAKNFVVNIIDRTTNDVARGHVRIVTVEGGDEQEYINGTGIISVEGETLNFVVFLADEGYVEVDSSYEDPVITIYVEPSE